jgi:hypothetical protein
VLEDGRPYEVQYFERARFERHPEVADPQYRVLLGQFGRRILAEVELLAGRFAQLYASSPAVRARLGPPMTPQRPVPGAVQAFERGRMVYLSDPPAIFALCADPSPRWARHPDPFAEGQPAGGGPGPAAGLYEPRRGFGTVWRERPEVRACLGYATTPDEQGATLVVQPFAQGLLLDDPVERAIDALYYAGGGDGFPGAYERYPYPAR